jgi:hypothetical protein
MNLDPIVERDDIVTLPHLAGDGDRPFFGGHSMLLNETHFWRLARRRQGAAD